MTLVIISVVDWDVRFTLILCEENANVVIENCRMI